MSFTEYLQIPEIATRYRKIKPFFRLRQSAYDMTSRCQLRCEGCFYFQGDKYQVTDLTDIDHWSTFFESEKKRGINYINLAGAEPALVPKLLLAAYNHISQGTIFTNGLKHIDNKINYRIHISIWGNAEGDKKFRGVDCLPKQLENYRGDKRALFVYTFNRHNIDEFDEVAEKIISEGHKLTFNFFSQPVGEPSELTLNEEARQKCYTKIINSITKHPKQILFSQYGAAIHTNSKSLLEQFGCPYPRISLGKQSGIGQTFRSYRADLTHTQEDNCCIPDTDCSDCRHYAAGSVIVSARLDSHIESENQFRGWLDYLDAQLAIWLTDYTRDPELYNPYNN